jgi:hypothetical protein
MRHSGSAALAVALDVSAWGRGGLSGPDPVPWLTSHGWRAVVAGPRDPIAGVWQELGLLGQTRDSGRGGLITTERA